MTAMAALIQGPPGLPGRGRPGRPGLPGPQGRPGTLFESESSIPCSFILCSPLIALQISCYLIGFLLVYRRVLDVERNLGQEEMFSK